MTVARAVLTAAHVVLSGDDSGYAAAALESALHTFHPCDEAFEDLLEALALYSPADGPPYTSHKQLCDAILASPIKTDLRRDDRRR